MIAAIFVPFQIGGLGGQLMNWVSNLGKGLAGGVGRAGVKALDDRFQIGERTKGAWAKTPFGKYQQRAALGKELVKSNTDAANKETQEEFLFKRLKHFEETKTNNSNNPEYVATLRKYRAIASERNAPFEKLSFDQKAALVEKFDRDHKGDIQKIVNGKTPTSANFKEAGDLRALLAEIDKDRNSFDPNTRAKQQQFENKYYPNSNRDFYGNLKPNNMEPDQAVIQAIKENYADKTTEQKQLIRDFSSGKLNNIPQTVITRAEELSGFKPDPKKPDQHLSLDEVYHNKFTARVQNKTENILASHDKSRYNNNVLQNMKTYIDNNDFQGASSYARRHNMHGLLPELKTLQPHSIEHATLSRSLDEMINANKAVTTNRTTSMDQMRADIEVKLDAINKDPSLTKNNSYDPVQLTLQQDIIKRFDQQMNYINTNSSYETYNQSIGNTYNNSKKAESVKQIIKDFQDPSKYSKAYIEDLLPEIDTNRRNEISSNVEAMGAEYQNLLAERIYKIYQKNPPKNPSTKQPSQPAVTPVGQVHTAGGTKDIEDFEIGTHTEPTA